MRFKVAVKWLVTPANTIVSKEEVERAIKEQKEELYLKGELKDKV